MVSCASVNSIPISFSALWIISLVIRRGGVGEGRGEGDGVGICASAFNGVFDTTRPAAPAAGRSLTKLRRVFDVRVVFFIDVLMRFSTLARKEKALLVRAGGLSNSMTIRS